jgi:hypothetical protein
MVIYPDKFGFHNRKKFIEWFGLLDHVVSWVVTNVAEEQDQADLKDTECIHVKLASPGSE